MKNLPEIVRHIKANLDVNSIKRRLAASTRNEKDSKLYRMFCLMADEGLEDDRMLKKRIYGSETKAAFYNLKKRLYNELLAAISADLTQNEGKDSYFLMRIIATTHLRNAFTLWQQKLHRAALEELKTALEFAQKSLDSYFQAHLQHQILVLSTFYPDTRQDIFDYHNNIQELIDGLPTTNHLCLLYYKVRYINDFIPTENEAEQEVLKILKTYEKLLVDNTKPTVRLQILSGMLNCYERLNNSAMQKQVIDKWLKIAAEVNMQHPEFLANRQLMLKRKQKLLVKLNEKSNENDLNWLDEFTTINAKKERRVEQSICFQTTVSNPRGATIKEMF